MEEHKLLFTEWINDGLAWLLSLFFDADPSREILPTHLIMVFLAAGILIILLKLSTRHLDFFPGRFQTMVESVYGLFENLATSFIGPEGRKYVPVIGTLGLFIFTSNMLGLFPELASPTANLNVTIGCAIFVFVYYHIQGIKAHGLFSYLGHFAGPIWYLSFIFFPIEIISHISRPLSLSLRLFVNIFGEDLVIISFAIIFAYIVPLPIMAFAIFTSILQAYIFIALSLIYLSGAVASEH